MSRRILSLVCLLFLCQGCFVYRYSTTPRLSGTVENSATKQPIAEATVGFRKHKHTVTRTAVDGSFVLKPDHVWRPCWFMPGELWAEGGTLFIEADGYEPLLLPIHTRHGSPYVFHGPIELHPTGARDQSDDPVR